MVEVASLTAFTMNEQLFVVSTNLVSSSQAVIVFLPNHSKTSLVDLLFEASCGLEGREEVETVTFWQFDESIVKAEESFSLWVDTREYSFVGFIERNLKLNLSARR